MSVDVDTQPVGLEADDAEDDLNHIVCCNPDVALCGADATGLVWGDIDEVEPEDCVVCEDLQGSSCGAAFCRMRRWWRWSPWGRGNWGTPP